MRHPVTSWHVIMKSLRWMSRKNHQAHAQLRHARVVWPVYNFPIDRPADSNIKWLTAKQNYHARNAS